MKTITKVSGGVSDLFFNYDHPEYDKLFKSKQEHEEITDQEATEAITADAKAFLDALDLVIVTGYTQSDLAADFLARV